MATNKSYPRNVCVYCGSRSGDNPKFSEMAERLGDEFAREGVGLVFGAGQVGLMGAIGQRVLDRGGYVIGIIPHFLKEKEVALEASDELIVTETMHERKRHMFDRADAFVVMPGGIGTLDEMVEMITWSQLSQHDKPVVLLNVDGYWEPFLALLDHMIDHDFTAPIIRDKFLVTDDPKQVLPIIRNANTCRGSAKIKGA